MFCLRQLHCQCLVYALPLLRLLVSTAPLRYYCQQLHKLDRLVNIVPPPILPYLLAVSLRLGRFSGHLRCYLAPPTHRSHCPRVPLPSLRSFLHRLRLLSSLVADSVQRPPRSITCKRYPMVLRHSIDPGVLHSSPWVMELTVILVRMAPQLLPSSSPACSPIHGRLCLHWSLVLCSSSPPPPR